MGNSSEETVDEIPFDAKQHASDVLRTLNLFRENKQQCDFEIIAGTKKFFVHQNILCANSEYFRAMLEHDTAEKQNKIVELKDVNEDCIATCIDFMYGKQITVSRRHWSDMFNAADRLQLLKLLDYLILLLEKKLDGESLYEIRTLSQRYNLVELMKNCVVYATKNFVQVAKSSNLGKFDVDYITDLLTSPNIKGFGTAKLQTLVNWANYDPGNRSACIHSILMKMDLSESSMQYRRYLLDREPLISESFQCFKLVSLSLLDGASIHPCKEVPNIETQTEANSVVVFDNRTRAMKLLSPATDKLKTLKDIPTDCANSNFSATACKGTVYVFMKDKRVFKLLIEQDNSCWQQRQSMTHGHGSWPCVVTNDDVIYAIDGVELNSPSCVEAYHSEINQWKLLTKGTGRCFLSAALIQGKLYCIGGQVNGSIVATVSVFDLEKKVWADAQPLPSPRYSSAAVKRDSLIYVIGGYCGFHEVNETLVMDTVVDQWSILKPMCSSRHCLNACVIGDHIYAVGGWFSGGTIERYSISKNEWELVSSNKLQVLWSTGFPNS